MNVDKQQEEIEKKHKNAIVAASTTHNIFMKKFLGTDPTMVRDGVQSFFKRFAMYEPRAKKPQGKLLSNQDEWIEEVAKLTNPRMSDYLHTVREHRAKKNHDSPDRVTEAMAYKLNGRTVIKLPMVKAWEDTSCGARKYMLGNPSRIDPQKNILVVGAKDCGKSTLIDCVTNHALGVKWEDKFTLRITDPEENSPNRPKWINVYTIPSTSNTTLPFALNIVDMPGFSTVRQNRVDEQEVVDNLKKFMNAPVAHEVDCFSAIWFVYNAQAKAVHPMYLQVYRELVQMYGEQLQHKVTNLVGFSEEDDDMPVMKAIADSELWESNKHFFNNMIAFNKMKAIPYSNANKVEKSLQAAWSGTQEALDALSEKVESEKPVSLHITPDNLERRDQATEGLRQLNNLVRIGCQRLRVMEEEKNLIEEKVRPDVFIEKVPDFEYKIFKPVKVKRNLPYCGEQVTNCSICFVTCHANCAVVDDDAKYGCCAMKDGYCTVCPGNCYWDQHFNRAFQIFLKMEKHTKKFSDLPEEYKVDKKEKVGILLNAIDSSSDEAKKYVEGNIEKAIRNLQLINEISGRRVSSAYDDCIDVIIHEEMRDGMPEWEDRVEFLRKVKEEGKLGVRIKGKEDTEKML